MADSLELENRRLLKQVADLELKYGDAISANEVLKERARIFEYNATCWRRDARAYSKEVDSMRDQLASVAAEHGAPCDECHGTGADLKQLRGLIKDGELIDDEVLVAMFEDETGDYAPSCPEVDCFGGFFMEVK